jgi:hypothetical protein
MKNILAENMIRFGTKNLSESAKLILTEQDDDYWANVKTIDPKSKTKRKYIDYPVQQLKDPETGLTLALNDSTGKKSNMLSISARLHLNYNESVDYAIDASKLLTSKFSYYAEFYLQSDAATTPALISSVNGGLLKSGKFFSYPMTYVKDWIATTKSEPVYPAKDSNDTTYLGKRSLDIYNRLGNFITYRLLPGYTKYAALNDIVTKMNTELAAAGYQEFTKLSNESPK